MLEDFPALIWSNGSSQVFTERAELELGVQEAAEGASENNAAGRFELRVSEVLDCQSKLPSAEEDDDRSSKTLMRKVLKRARQPRKARRSYIEG